VKIGELAHQTEDLLGLIRSRELVPTPARVHVLLRATDRLHELIQNPGISNKADIGEILADLMVAKWEGAGVDSAGCLTLNADTAVTAVLLPLNRLINRGTRPDHPRRQ
jgi:chemotaxis protein histidine kinase CheA